MTADLSRSIRKGIKAMGNSDRWEPIAKPGGIYCSPACGFNCTKADYDQAVADGVALAERMGAGWRASIWENLGWHYNVHKGCAKIRPRRDHDGSTVYAAWIEPEVEGLTAMQFICDAADPNDALGFAVQEANTVMSRIREALDAICNDEVKP